MASNGTGLLVVGGGLASARAVKAYREAGGEGAVTLISADDFLPYHRPPLSKKFLRGESEAEDALVESEAFYREHDIDVVLGTRATGFRADERVVVATDGEHRFEKLLIATGASPNRLEVAASLSQLELEVTLVHRGKGLFETLRARQLAQFLTELYGTKGVHLVLGDEVAEFAGRDSLDSVRTKRGEVYQAELAVVGVGVRPNTDWLDGGLRIDDGVIVNERYETGLPDVWAVGDVARFYDPVFERYRRIEHWSNANHQGTDVGKLIAGGDGDYDIV